MLLICFLVWKINLKAFVVAQSPSFPVHLPTAKRGGKHAEARTLNETEVSKHFCPPVICPMKEDF
jgi:hypothetical protein